MKGERGRGGGEAELGLSMGCSVVVTNQAHSLSSLASLSIAQLKVHQKEEVRQRESSFGMGEVCLSSPYRLWGWGWGWGELAGISL